MNEIYLGRVYCQGGPPWYEVYKVSIVRAIALAIDDSYLSCQGGPPRELLAGIAGDQRSGSPFSGELGIISGHNRGDQRFNVELRTTNLKLGIEFLFLVYNVLEYNSACLHHYRYTVGLPIYI